MTRMKRGNCRILPIGAYSPHNEPVFFSDRLGKPERPEAVPTFPWLVATASVIAKLDPASSASSGASGSLTLSCELRGAHHVKCL